MLYALQMHVPGRSHAPILSTAFLFASLVFNTFSTVSGNLLLNINQNVPIMISARDSQRNSTNKPIEILTKPYCVPRGVRQQNSTIPAVRMVEERVGY